MLPAEFQDCSKSYMLLPYSTTDAMSIRSRGRVQVGKLSTKTKPPVKSQRLQPCTEIVGITSHPSPHLANYLHSHELPEAE